MLARLLPNYSTREKAEIVYRYIKAHQRLPETKIPQRFNDILLKMKLSNDLYDPIRQFVTDKEYVKIYISAIVGSQYNLQTLQILRNEEDIRFLNLTVFPCILKPTHRSGNAMIVKKSGDVDLDILYKWITKESNYFHESKEKNYRYLKPKIIVEEFFSEDSEKLPFDYKFFCFNGKVKFIQVDIDRFTRHTRNFYDTNWNRLPFSLIYNTGISIPSPPKLDEMIFIASKLSEPFCFVRIDMFSLNNKIRVGEITNLPESGLGKFFPSEVEYELGKFFV